MTIAPYYLHWGRIDLKITTTCDDPASGNITPDSGAGVTPTSTGRGKAKVASGRGSSKRMSGSGGNG